MNNAMARNIIRLTENELNEAIWCGIQDFVSTSVNERINNNILVEMARINTNDNGLFPYKSYNIKIWSNDHNPPDYSSGRVLFLKNQVSNVEESYYQEKINRM